MIDPVDDLTRDLPVASSSPIRLRFAAAGKTHTVLLMQDLLEQWVLMQAWGGRNESRGGARTRAFESLEAGLAALAQVVNKHLQQGNTQLA
ncbi:MAG: hypothetical protein ACRYF5_13925 [Janthinobacterium lividum]